MSVQQRLESELRRLDAGPTLSELPMGLGTVRFIVHCPKNAPAVLQRATEVMRVVNRHSRGAWPADDVWRSLLPQWFVDRCAPEQTAEEAEAWLAWWRQLPPEEQSEALHQESWSLSGWIYWFIPEERTWCWWDAKVIQSDTLLVAVEVDEWPFPWGALAWLFRAAGAERIDAESEAE